jgi:hypothetical protein
MADAASARMSLIRKPLLPASQGGRGAGSIPVPGMGYNRPARKQTVIEAAADSILRLETYAERLARSVQDHRLVRALVQR